MVEVVARDECPVDDESRANSAKAKPLDIHIQNLRLGGVQRQARRASAVHRVLVPVCLSHTGIDHRPRHAAALDHVVDGAFALKVNAVGCTVIASALAQVGLGRAKNERVHHQQALTRLIRKDFNGLADDLIPAGRPNSQVHQAFVGVKCCRCGAGDAVDPQVVVGVSVR